MVPIPRPSAGRTRVHPDRRGPDRGTSRTRLLDAAIDVIRAQGLSATTVDDLCAAAGVSKGAFFHHFANKEALAVAAAEYWGETTSGMFATAPYHEPARAADRVLAYVDFRASLIGDAPEAYSCVAGTMVQEAFANAAIRDACGDAILDHAATLDADIAEALRDAGSALSDDALAEEAASLARYTQIVLQGAFVVSKAANDPGVVLDAIGHLRTYLRLRFDPTTEGALR